MKNIFKSIIAIILLCSFADATLFQLKQKFQDVSEISLDIESEGSLDDEDAFPSFSFLGNTALNLNSIVRFKLFQACSSISQKEIPLSFPAIFIVFQQLRIHC